MALDDYLASEIVLDCADGIFDRRKAPRRLMLLGITTPAASALLAACSRDGETLGSTSSPTATATVTPLTTAANSPGTSGSRAGGPPEEITFAGPQGDLIGLYAAASDPSGAVLVIHENRGLTPHIRSIPPRLAGDGYTALAIDLLSEEGGTASMPTDGDATAALSKAPAERLIADLRAGLDELQRRAPTQSLP